MTIPTLLLAIGGTLWIGNLILFKNSIIQKTVGKTMLCIIMPINLITLYITVWGIIGV
jgi:hypothetical protein